MTTEASNTIDELINEWHTNAKYGVPLGIIDERPDSENSLNGFEVALFFYWSAQKKLLTEKIEKLVSLYQYELNPISHQSILNAMKKTIGTYLMPYFYNEKGKDFSVDYLSLVSEWKYNYYKDIIETYSNKIGVLDIPENDESYANVFVLLDKRLEEYGANVSMP